MPTLQWLWRVGAGLALALSSGLLLLLMTALLLVALPAALYGAALGAAWCWSRHPHLLGRAAAAGGVALAAGVLAGLLNEAREWVRALRFRLDPEAERRAYVRHYYRLPRVVHAPRPW